VWLREVEAQQPDQDAPDCDCTDCDRAFYEWQMCPECGYCLSCCDCPPLMDEDDEEDCPYCDEDSRGWSWNRARRAELRNEVYWMMYD